MNMNRPQVGIRELKTNLSKYLRQVKAGKTLVVTERGVPIGHLIPASTTLEQRMQILIETGMVTWNGKKLRQREPLTLEHAQAQVSELIIEDRNVDYLS